VPVVPCQRLEVLPVEAEGPVVSGWVISLVTGDPLILSLAGLTRVHSTCRARYCWRLKCCGPNGDLDLSDLVTWPGGGKVQVGWAYLYQFRHEANRYCQQYPEPLFSRVAKQYVCQEFLCFSCMQAPFPKVSQAGLLW